MSDEINVLGMPGHTALATEQARRVTCLALAFSILRGRNVHVHAVWAIARWLYDGEYRNE